MTRMTGPDCAIMCNLINTHTHDRAGLRGYVQFNKYTHTHTHTHTHFLDYIFKTCVVVHHSLSPLTLPFSSRHTLYSILHTPNSILYTLYSILYTLYSILYALYSILYTLNYIHTLLYLCLIKTSVNATKDTCRLTLSFQQTVITTVITVTVMNSY